MPLYFTPISRRYADASPWIRLRYIFAFRRRLLISLPLRFDMLPLSLRHYAAAAIDYFRRHAA